MPDREIGKALFQIKCLCGGDSTLTENAVLHTVPPCDTYMQLPAGIYARGLRIWWNLETLEENHGRDAPGTCKRVSSSDVMPGWGCCQCKLYNGIGRDRCKGCDHLVCGLNDELVEAAS